MTLVLGPVLRHVGETTASVWVQTDRPASVSVLGCSARTFEVAGHHYALVPVTGLTPGSITPYEVEVDGERVWPPAAHPFPPSVIRTRGGAERHRILFGSCRYPKVTDRKIAAQLGVDALDAYAARMAGRPHEEWPDALLLLGDQVYADELTQRDRRRITSRADRHPDWPDDEIVGYDEYVGLYRDSWSDPEIRWLMSTVPTAMIFDDHDVRDDWNTSAAWRAEMNAKPWWRERIRAALASYWVYQHIGNLAPEELAADPDHRKITGHDGDTWPLLVELADRADAEVDGAKGVRFSFRWDIGRTRLLMVDSRNGRILEDGMHLMLGESEFSWIEREAAAPGEVDHLLVGTSVPWLLPHAISDLETVNEIAAERPGLRGRIAEAVRQAADLEHWPAFRASFDRLTAMIGRAARSGVATVTVLSGDVHHSYAARAVLPDGPAAPVHQLTCSPVHNQIQWFVRPGFRLAWSRLARRVGERWAERAGAPPKPLTWRRLLGPLFGNTIATLDLEGRRAQAVFEQPVSSASLAERARLDLTG
ncbi:MAG TPA: alkaline phosphatase D family protein [Pseudonocardia sp.]|uniref:alkaline phosphatase D family protein n=1 Tax=Pseudonocardia sp. TaxID=60912 RepID=UPI002B4B37B3|nr:alkaline phosphatase D family protein [Pseudonocardia sp.]HLU55782.1 alkaline phosphatase D family protein [Pseudonocardia sp.]